MKNIFKKTINLTLLVFIFVGAMMPAHSLFALITDYQLLAPLPGMNTFDVSMLGGIDALGPYLNTLVGIFIGVCAALAVVMIVIGGMQYMTSELISSKEAGKERIRNAMFGLLLAVGAWLILNTINSELLSTTPLKAHLTTQAISADIQYADTPQATPPPGGSYADGHKPGEAFQSNVAPSAPPPPVNKGECTSYGQQNCTSTKGLDMSIVNGIKAACPSCALTITGGTESWLHGANSSHHPGSATVDLGVTPSLNNAITGNSNFPSSNQIYKSGSTCYFAEHAGSYGATTGDHWHCYKC